MQMWNKRQRLHNSGSNSSLAAQQFVLQTTTQRSVFSNELLNKLSTCLMTLERVLSNELLSKLSKWLTRRQQ